MGLTGIVIAALVGGFLWWANERDKALMQWAERYEECVQVEYGTTPSAWYLEQGEYPECDTTNYGN